MLSSSLLLHATLESSGQPSGSEMTSEPLAVRGRRLGRVLSPAYISAFVYISARPDVTQTKRG